MKALLPFAGLVWAAAAALGFATVWRYAYAPGEQGPAPATWPEESALALDAERPTLVMFAHPRCPCTRASLRELDRLLARCGGRASAHVLFYRPLDAPDEWTHTDLREHARAIPGVEVLTDPDAREARRFGALVSGQALLFTPDGALAFSGGITPARGHSGDNRGRAALVDLLLGRPAAHTTNPVFGCPLFDEPARATGEASP